MKALLLPLFFLLLCLAACAGGRSATVGGGPHGGGVAVSDDQGLGAAVGGGRYGAGAALFTDTVFVGAPFFGGGVSLGFSLPGGECQEGIARPRRARTIKPAPERMPEQTPERAEDAPVPEPAQAKSHGS